MMLEEIVIHMSYDHKYDPHLKTLMLLCTKKVNTVIYRDIREMILINFIICCKNGLNKAFIFAIYTGKMEWIKKLIEYGADIHYKCDRPLIVGVVHRRLQVVNFLISIGADVNAKSSCPLKWSTQYNYKEMIDTLVNSKTFVRNKEPIVVTCQNRSVIDILKKYEAINYKTATESE